VRFLAGDAERLPFPAGTFDGLTIGFGIRNVADLDVGVAEMFRVMKPGGRIAVLEFSRPRTFLLSQLYFLYFRCALPLIGRLVSGHDAAYQYLYESVMRFPEGQAFLDRLAEGGFTRLSERRLTLGIATAYVAERPKADGRMD
jgi:demethylmenaquinone methyltransferase/2-methoxy-6-polyprenyl-1,4-benzoquinol methylase